MTLVLKYSCTLYIILGGDTMADAMVTARMPLSKKDAGNEILHELGYSASRAINELYDRVIETRSWPLAPKATIGVDATSLAEALSFVDGISRINADDLDGFSSVDFDTAKRQRLVAKGRAKEEDFE